MSSAPMCPECGSDLTVLEDWPLSGSRFCMCANGHAVDAIFDRDADQWRAQMAWPKRDG